MATRKKAGLPEECTELELVSIKHNRLHTTYTLVIDTPDDGQVELDYCTRSKCVQVASNHEGRTEAGCVAAHKLFSFAAGCFPSPPMPDAGTHPDKVRELAAFAETVGFKLTPSADPFDLWEQLMGESGREYGEPVHVASQPLPEFSDEGADGEEPTKTAERRQAKKQS